MNKSFSPFKLKTGLLFDYSDNQYPTRLLGFADNQPLLWEGNGTLYGYVYKGITRIITTQGEYEVPQGMYFCLNHSATIIGGSGIAVERTAFHGVFMIGGPIEPEGRLKYIDGCTDSLLIPPVKKGDPCFNHLHFPPRIDQTQHTHPSMRVGMVVKGTGECITPEGIIPLFPGQVFIIHEEGLHSFRTTGESMDVIAYHPDSDFGPEDENHPMVNRTIVNGISASVLDEIRTK
jgi:mannose-6-phosphate isomerase-like protein (cupin superfamily)